MSKLNFRIVGAALALGFALAGASAAKAEPPANGMDIKGKTVYLAPGARLRYGKSLLSRVYARINGASLELVGDGVCTPLNCPVVHNKIPVFARLSRLDLVKPTGPVVTERTLRRGDDGDDVKAMQEVLNKKANAKLTLDGKFGSGMEQAVRDFQTKAGITVDGEIGPATREKLKA